MAVSQFNRNAYDVNCSHAAQSFSLCVQQLILGDTFLSVCVFFNITLFVGADFCLISSSEISFVSVFVNIYYMAN